MASWNDEIIREFRAHRGKVGGGFEGATMLLLHTIGRRTRRERVTPLVYLPDHDRWVVIASKGGAPAHPDWLWNLEASPDVTIEVGNESIPVHSSILRDGPERDQLYQRQVERRPAFAEYEAKTRGIRTIPVVVLDRRDL